MKKEYKELLLKDLSARLPYGVEIELMPITRGKCVTLTTIILQDYFISDDVNYLPYLRPMSSMTEEEMKEYHSLIEEQKNIPYFTFCSCVTGYLDSIHVDHRAMKDKDGKWKTMIELGLALPAPEGMYK